MSLLKNAIDSIIVGLEGYISSDERRIISSARNIFAGILLLFKYKLSLLSPPDSNEVLIKQYILPFLDKNGNLQWKGHGKKTVDVRTIQERFKTLGIDVDWQRIERINKLRNDIEHYYTILTPDSIKELLSESFLIINDFIRRHLKKDPKKLLGEKAWNILIKINEVYEREKEECINAIKTLKFFNSKILEAIINFSCDKCGSGLIMPSSYDCDATEVKFNCRMCGETFSYEKIVKLALEDYFSYEIYISVKEGGIAPITECPECGGIYLYNEKICSLCGYVAEHKCQRCGSTIPPEELSSEPFCGYCAYIMSKDD